MDDRERILSALWAGVRGLDAQRVGNFPAAARAIAAGAEPADVVQAMTAYAYEATFNALFVLTSEEDLTALATSGALDGLHEDLLTADPTGDEGRDLFR